ncbi:MAG: GntR family transcriptional regulator [Roseovarius pacificus]|nr:GntR family transcriptional regulator [Roseovarius pacificus]
MGDTGDWAIGGTQTLREKTVEVLRDALLNQVFKPGDKLVERTLADRTGVSRTSVREALRELEAEGLVTRESGKGVFVTRVSESEAAQIYEARVILESATARLFAERAGPEALKLWIGPSNGPRPPTSPRRHSFTPTAWTRCRT